MTICHNKQFSECMVKQCILKVHNKNVTKNQKKYLFSYITIGRNLFCLTLKCSFDGLSQVVQRMVSWSEVGRGEPGQQRL